MRKSFVTPAVEIELSGAVKGKNNTPRYDIFYLDSMHWETQKPPWSHLLYIISTHMCTAKLPVFSFGSLDIYTCICLLHSYKRAALLNTVDVFWQSVGPCWNKSHIAGHFAYKSGSLDTCLVVCLLLSCFPLDLGLCGGRCFQYKLCLSLFEDKIGACLKWFSIIKPSYCNLIKHDYQWNVLGGVCFMQNWIPFMNVIA